MVALPPASTTRAAFNWFHCFSGEIRGVQSGGFDVWHIEHLFKVYSRLGAAPQTLMKSVSLQKLK
ncbi:hypothetical protein HPP92_002860 [Vanilla planifolia]|uniref:Uncharacterized protein n=1 Tax=Vanilla planifolia TaxID=51239 RepID=A0A835RU46_VANPL|nr:hypothetical protein HPP92_002860 [Vanilla planifolia]